MNKIQLSIFVFLIFFQSLKAQKLDELPQLHRTDWQEMNASKRKTFEWFKEAKFGMFIHWGLYSIPGGIWKGKKMEEMSGPSVAEWIMLGAKIPRNEYAELADIFNPVQFNADSIALLAKQTGMKYIVITAKHHDGFAMYHSSVSKFNIVDATPFGKDAIKELYDACRKYGLEFGIYYSHNIDWMDGSDAQTSKVIENKIDIGIKNKAFGANTWDPSPNSFDEYLQNKAYPQVKELMRELPDIKLLWYDMPWRMDPDQSFNFYKIVYEENPNVIITERIGNGYGDYFIPGDNQIPASSVIIKKPWETVGTTNNSWGYKSYDNDWKSSQELIYWLVAIASKGGNYMLNIGPRGDGSIPEKCAINLRKVGEWLNVNGEAIYGTAKWNVAHEGPSDLLMENTEARARDGFKENFTSSDFWFTQKKNIVYVISLVKPLNDIVIKSLKDNAGKVRKVEILGYGKVNYSQTDVGLQLNCPENFHSENGFVVKVYL